MPNVRGYRRKDGTRVRAHWRRPAAGAGVAVTVGAFTFAMTGSGGESAALKPRPPSRARVSHDAIPAVAQAGFNRAKAALVASGYRAKWLARAYVQLGYSEVLVAISWVEMPTTRLAADYKKLVDTPDAGGITELSRDEVRYRKIDYADSAHTAGMNGMAVWNVQAVPIVPRTTAEITKILVDSRQ
jgi:hypothetical protein